MISLKPSILPLPVAVTPKAKAEVENIMLRKGIPEGYFLRIGVKGGGCSGISYVLGFDTPKTSDDYYETEGLKVLIEKKHTMYLLGVTLDFEENAEVRGFFFQNN